MSRSSAWLKKRVAQPDNDCRLTSSRFFIEDVQRGGIVAAWGVAGSLTPGLVARLVGVPQLPAVVAELCVASLAPTAQLGTLCTAVSYYCVAEEREKLLIKKKTIIHMLTKRGLNPGSAGKYYYMLFLQGLHFHCNSTHLVGWREFLWKAVLLSWRVKHVEGAIVDFCWQTLSACWLCASWTYNSNKLPVWGTFVPELKKRILWQQICTRSLSSYMPKDFISTSK